VQITIVTVGKRIPAWASSAVLEYGKRLSHEISLQIVDIQPGRKGKHSRTRLLQEEAHAIQSALKKGEYTIALDEHGIQQSTRDLAARMDGWMHEGSHVGFIIGGAEGLDKSVLENTDECWSLSEYTLPHALVRVLLTEQLYRAWSMLRNHPYHRE